MNATLAAHALVLMLCLLFVGCQSVNSQSLPAPIQPQPSSSTPTPTPTPTLSPPIAADVESNLARIPMKQLTITRPLQMGMLHNPALIEVSGLAASLRQNNVLWMINDSGNSAILYATTLDGRALGQWRVAAKNRDWEDMASVRLNGEPYLLIADIGDNLRIRDEYVVYVVNEPATAASPPDGTLLRPIATLRFRYADGSHNAESLATDGEWLYILTKQSADETGRGASGVYRLPFNLDAGQNLLVAEPFGIRESGRSTIESSLIAALTGVDINQPTALDIDRHNRFAYVLTYRHVLRFERQTDATWTDTLLRAGELIHTHSLGQAEALAIGDAGNVWFTSENIGAPLWVLPAPAERH